MLIANIHPNKNKLAFIPSGGIELFIAQLSVQLKQPILYIVSDIYLLNATAAVIELFAPHLKVTVFSDYETLPYERQSPSTYILANRLKALWQLMQQQLDVIIIAANTLHSLLPPKYFCAQRVLSLNCGDIINIDVLKSALQLAGYNAVEQVQAAGEFAIRGAVIDIMTVNAKTAVRIELDDVQIEHIYQLDVLSKVTTPLNAIEILPTREFPTDSNSLRVFSEALAAKLPQLAVDLAHYSIPAGLESYLPLLFSALDNTYQHQNICEYLAKECQIVYHDSLTAQLTSSWNEINTRYELCKQQYPCLHPAEIFLPPNTILANLKHWRRWEIATDGAFHTMFDAIPTQHIAAIIAQRTHKVLLCAATLGKAESSRISLKLPSTVIVKSWLDAQLMLEQESLVVLVAPISQSFRYNTWYFIAATAIDSDKLSIQRYSSKPLVSTVKPTPLSLSDIKLHDYIVHLSHGIGRFLGVRTTTIDDIDYEMIELEYAAESKLFIPIQQIYLLHKYTNLDTLSVELTFLGSKSWLNIKKKAEKVIDDTAAYLLALYAKRDNITGRSFKPDLNYSTFTAAFHYQTTTEQQISIDAVIADLASTKAMDRLICGDVGFGKTEVALRAAYIVAATGAQVAIIAPTTLLSEQLYHNFSNRFVGFGIKIAEVSRFKTKSEIAQHLAALAIGEIKIIIGTHRLLQRDIKFSDLALVIIDEEHRFGVTDKEKLKSQYPSVDILALTATPIPRTLSMAIEGLRDFSIITTPPVRRIPVQTLVIQESNTVLLEAMLREIRRGGQVFFLYNDVASIEYMQHKLYKILPELRIAIAHGQMPEKHLDGVIRDFIAQQYNLLLCSTIIESGIDIPNANTIIIYRADKFGMAQLHQLRGRVGRSHHQAYCYLLVPSNITEDAQKRLDAIIKTTALGSGFNLAVQDLEIRGAGEVFSKNQAGNLKQVGVALYSDLLQKALKKASNLIDTTTCDINLHSTAIIPHTYCASIEDRLAFYQQLATAHDQQQLDVIYQDLINQYGLAPIEVKTLITIHVLRIIGANLGVNKIDSTKDAITIVFVQNPIISATALATFCKSSTRINFTKDYKLIYKISSKTCQEKIVNTTMLLNALQKYHDNDSADDNTLLIA